MQGVTGGVESMSSFLQAFFPSVRERGTPGSNGVCSYRCSLLLCYCQGTKVPAPPPPPQVYASKQAAAASPEATDPCEHPPGAAADAAVASPPCCRRCCCGKPSLVLTAIPEAALITQCIFPLSQTACSTARRSLSTRAFTSWPAWLRHRLHLCRRVRTGKAQRGHRVGGAHLVRGAWLARLYAWLFVCTPPAHQRPGRCSSLPPCRWMLAAGAGCRCWWVAC